GHHHRARLAPPLRLSHIRADAVTSNATPDGHPACSTGCRLATSRVANRRHVGRARVRTAARDVGWPRLVWPNVVTSAPARGRAVPGFRLRWADPGAGGVR